VETHSRIFFRLTLMVQCLPENRELELLMLKKLLHLQSLSYILYILND